MVPGFVELEWRRTWSDDLTLEDYTGIDHDMAVGRLYHLDGHSHPWRWFFAGSGGAANSRREAMLELEAAYNSARARQPSS